MKTLWCWRCQMDIPMLDEKEYAIAAKLYNGAFKGTPNVGNMLVFDLAAESENALEERFQPLLDYYNQLTGFGETVPAAIMHHRIAQYGPPCENCGKPYRTPQASFCAACGNKRIIDSGSE